MISSQPVQQVPAEMFAIVAHELRERINVIKITHALLERFSSDEPDQQRALATMGESIRRAEQLLRTIMDASLLEAGQLRVSPASVDVARLLESAIEHCREEAARQNITLQTRRVPADQIVAADEVLVLQVFANLIGNAIKYSPEGSTIWLDAQDKAEEVEFSVIDEGPGLSTEEMGELFRAWSRFPRAGKEGTGLGLYVSNGIVRAHGGRIWVESSKESGSTFHFCLPKATAPLLH